MLKIDDHELMEVAFRFERAAGKVYRDARQAVTKTISDMSVAAKIHAPVRTGNLRNSIRHREVTASTDMIVGEVNPGATYAIYVEYGTSRMGPQPFMHPAYDQHVGAFKQAMQQLAERALS
ncbi:MAG: HK97-gp10 family putative phage morphogenesis protein [Candidatus Nanopelagicales bacterium]